jgi:DNA repair protein RecO (recombination protein O)
MAPVKTRAIVLHVQAYRESSVIVRLYSLQNGLLHGIARGVRGGRDKTVVERGMIVEALVYLKSHGTLHTLGSISAVSFFPVTRHDLLLSAMRDAALELVMRVVHPSDPGAELYQTILRFLEALEQTPPESAFPAALWRFCVDFAGQLGFAPDLSRCVACGQPLSDEPPGQLNAERGGVLCPRCTAGGAPQNMLPAEILRFLRGSGYSLPSATLSAAEQRRITRLLAAYCCYHSDVQPALHALDFVCSMIT